MLSLVSYILNAMVLPSKKITTLSSLMIWCRVLENLDIFKWTTPKTPQNFNLYYHGELLYLFSLWWWQHNTVGAFAFKQNNKKFRGIIGSFHLNILLLNENKLVSFNRWYLHIGIFALFCEVHTPENVTYPKTGLLLLRCATLQRAANCSGPFEPTVGD